MSISVERVAVLGAGTMGAQIAALFAGAGVLTYLYDLPAQKGPKNGISQAAIEGLSKLDPSPLFSQASLLSIVPCNYEEHLSHLKSCDLLIEAVAEKIEIKERLFAKLAPHLSEHAIMGSNTSGLSIEALSNVLPDHLKSRFLGIHFFNPPRYLPLVELIPSSRTDAKLQADLESFLVTSLGKTVLYAKDTPNFIANRIGVMSILITLHYAQIFKIGFEVVDALTGKLLGRPKSATFRTADVVGLDVLSHAVETLRVGLPNDPWQEYFKLPSFLENLIQTGHLGQKSRSGIYEKRADGLWVFDVVQNQYRQATQKPDESVVEILKIKDAGERFKALRTSKSDQAQFIWACYRELFAYIAYTLPEIGHSVRDIDMALRQGYGWKEGPFELWQQADFKQIFQWMREDVKSNQTLTKVELPDWINDHLPYKDGKAWSPEAKSYIGRRQLPVYEQQLFPLSFITETYSEGETWFENEGIRFWHQGDGVGIISFKTKMCAISEQVLDGILTALELAKTHCQAIVIWQRKGDHFSVGADLMQAGEKFLMEGPEALETMLRKFQQAHLAVMHSSVPVVSAVRGYAFGGGCELLMHSHRVVAAANSFIGLVEVGVGLIPGAGGCKELARRAAASSNPEKSLQDAYRQVAMAEVAKSAFEAQRMGYLRSEDVVIFNPDELLKVAKNQALALVTSHHRPVLSTRFKVLGRPGIANLRWFLTNLRVGGQISEYDYTIADLLAGIMCGGDIDGGSLVDEEWILRKERQVFMTLVENEKTFQRIQHMLSTGKPLRN